MFSGFNRVLLAFCLVFIGNSFAYTDYYLMAVNDSFMQTYIHATVGDIFRVHFQPENSRQGPIAMDTCFEIDLDKQALLTVEYYQSYLIPGGITPQAQAVAVNAFNDLSTFHGMHDFNQFPVECYDGVGCYFRFCQGTANPYNRYINTDLVAFLSERSDSISCPAAQSGPIIVDGPTLIFPDFQDYKQSKSCNWRLKAPANGNVLVLRLLGEWKVQPCERMTITGSLDGNQNNFNISSVTELDEVFAKTLFDSKVIINFVRDVGYVAADPAFRILVDTMTQPVVLPGCSLAFHNSVFKDLEGTITNFVDFTPYDKNQDCLFHIEVPQGKCLELRPDLDIGAGDSFQITNPAGLPKHYLDSYPPPLRRINAPHAINVTFQFKTDGVHEGNGFYIAYRILDNACPASYQVPTNAPPTTGVPTIAVPTTSASTIAPATTSDSAPVAPATTSDSGRPGPLNTAFLYLVIVCLYFRV